MSPAPVDDPCIRNSCGLYAECRKIGKQAVCSCKANYVGSPPNCRPECIVNTDCPSNKACISEKCRDPCAGSCGQNTDCHVQNHIPTCHCQTDYTGDPFTLCSPIEGIQVNFYLFLFFLWKNLNICLNIIMFTQIVYYLSMQEK